MNISIGRLVNLYGAVVGVGITALVTVDTLSLDELKVGGPVYQDVIYGKDLIADILPPPAYVIEPYLEATLAMNDPASLSAHQDRLATLHKEYQARHEYWSNQPYAPDLIRMLTSDSDRFARTFWQAIEEELLPALAAKDSQAVAAAYAKVSGAYRDHRAVIDNIVAQANQTNQVTEAKAAAAEQNYQFWQLGTLLLVAVTMICGLCYMVRRVSKPIRHIATLMHEMAGGNLEVAIGDTARQDEIGEMSRAMQTLQASLLEGRRLSDLRDLDADAQKKRIAYLEGIVATFEARADELMQQIADSSHLLQASGSRLREKSETSKGNAAVANREAAEAAAGVQTVAVAAEELSASIREISRQTIDSKQAAVDAGTQFANMLAEIEALSTASNEIGDVTALISEIAGKTNLLALNAAIEAARAGEAGKGFSVVASEVKALASKTAAATQAISAKVQSIQAAIGASSARAEKIGDAIRLVGESNIAIVGAVEQQTSATAEIAQNTIYMSANVQKLTESMNAVCETVSDSSAVSAEVQEASGHLILKSEEIKGSILGFLADVRAAQRS